MPRFPCLPLATTVACASLAPFAAGQGTSCQPSWIPTFAGWSGPNTVVYALEVFDDGGAALYAGGALESVGGLAVNHIAKWDGKSWSALGSGMSGVPRKESVSSLTVFDDGGGSALYAGGSFASAGGVTAHNIAKWNGSSWSGLGTGVNGSVFAMTVFDDGSGPALYVGGNFDKAGHTFGGGITLGGIGKWDGTSWSALGSGITGGSGGVWALEVFDDGSGPALYAGGPFTSMDGVAAKGIAKWDGASWSTLGSGMGVDPPFGPSVGALKVFDDGGGPALYAGGYFKSAGGVAANSIAKWDGATWSALGSGMSAVVPVPAVSTLAAFDDGNGSALYAGGLFDGAGGVPALGVARWNGASWSALDGGLNGTVGALVGFDDGGGPSLYAGGGFSSSPTGDAYLAKWGCPAVATLPGCTGNPAKLEALAGSAPLGAPLPLRITGSDAVSGVGVVAYGALGIKSSGCGLIAPGLGELLLALVPVPKAWQTQPLAGGVCDLAPPVPSLPALSGLTVYLQAAAIDAALAQPIELANALLVRLGP